MHNLDYLADVLLLLGTSICILAFMYRLKMSPVLGYLVVGALIGRNGLDLVANEKKIAALADFGVVFLLFVIGLELTFDRLIKMRWHVIGLGGLQILFCTIALSYGINHIFEVSVVLSIIIAAALSLSSTAIVLQVLAESNRQSTQTGRISLAVLLMQDLAVVPLLAIIPILSTKTYEGIGSAIGLASLKALGAIIIITIFGRLFLKPFLSVIGSVKKGEIYVTASLVIALGAAWITDYLDLSSAMGAFLAGLLIAETEYRNRIEDSIMPFQGIFMAIFFLTVGMSIDALFILQNFTQIALLAAGLILVKGLIIAFLCIIFRLSKGTVVHSSFLLAQGGEFAFILFSLLVNQNILSESMGKLLLIVVAFSMGITPLLAAIGARIGDKLNLGEQLLDSGGEFRAVTDLNHHVIIAGFGRAGRVVAYMLSQQKISYIAIDSNASLVKKARTQGFVIYHGDLAREETIIAVGAKKAAAIVLTMSDKQSASKATKNIHKSFPKLKIITRTEDYASAKRMRKLGATHAIPTVVETGLQIGNSILYALETNQDDILNLENKIRKNEYSLMSDIELFKGSTQCIN